MVGKVEKTEILYMESSIRISGKMKNHLGSKEPSSLSAISHG
jgi:hypothetical protein